MVAVGKGKKDDTMPKGRQQSRPRKALTRRRNESPGPKRNVCLIRFPKSSYLTTCPLVSWYFNRRMRNDAFPLPKNGPSLGACMGGALHKVPLDRQRKPHPEHTCPAFLRNALREVARKKRAKWVVAASKKRRRYSDEEIFYRLADPSKLGEGENGRSASDFGANDAMPHASGLAPPASELQEALS